MCYDNCPYWSAWNETCNKGRYEQCPDAYEQDLIDSFEELDLGCYNVCNKCEWQHSDECLLADTTECPNKDLIIEEEMNNER